jgi:hypothetical protein
MASIRVTYDGKQWPLYRTNRATVNFKRMGFNQQQIADGDSEALLALGYCMLSACAKQQNLNFEDDFETFIDKSDDQVVLMFAELKKAEDAEAGGKKPKPVKQPATHLPKEPRDPTIATH